MPTEARSGLLGLPDNPFDVVDGSAVDLGNLGNPYAVLYQGADACELRRRYLARRRRLGADRRFDRIVTDRRRRRVYSEHARFARRLLIGRRWRFRELTALGLTVSI